MRPVLVRPLVLFLAVGLAAAERAEATTRIPYPEHVRGTVELAFLEAGEPSPARIGAYRTYLRDKRTWLERHSFDFRRRVQRQGRSRSSERAKGSDEMLALGHALDLLGELEAATDPAEVYRLGATILTLDYATRSFHYPLASIQTPIYIRNMLVDWSADGRTRPGDGAEEASNLVDPETGEFYTAAELDAMIARGEDISRLDPPSDGMLWRSTGDIAGVEIRENYLGGGTAQREGIPAVFPDDGARTQLRRLQLTQTKPKIHVWWLDEACRERPRREHRDCRRLFKIRVGSELHADPVVNSLMAALGYNHDVSVHRQGVRIDLGDTTRAEIARDWANYFDRQELWTRTALDSALLPGEEGHSSDEHGEYLAFRAVGVEARPRELRRIGDWSNGRIDAGAIATGMREARGLFMFNVWVANTDLKDAENNMVSLRQDGSGAWRVHLAQADSGNSLGRVLAEKADAFPWDAVETDWLQRAFGAARSRIELNYFALQNTGTYAHATHADHRWMIRRIAQLTRQQIEDAVGLGRFPGGIGALYVEKLIHRRNQLVRYFGLADEFDPIPVDRHITTADGSVVDGELVIGDFPEETIVDLGRHWRSLIQPLGPELWRLLRSQVAQAVSAVDSAGAEIETGDIEILPELLINVGRHVAPNPAPRNPLDQFIVEDTMTIGGRLTAGYVGRAGGSFRRRYRLAYTAPSVWEAKLHDNQALNWFLPRDVRREDLPESFVLMRTEERGPALTVGTSDTFELLPGADLALDWLRTQRTVVARRPEGGRVWLDGGRALRGELRLWLKLFLPRITFWRSTLEGGTLAGHLYRLAAGEVDSDEALSELLEGGAAALASHAAEPPRATEVAYSKRADEINLIFAGWRRRDRVDRMALESSSGADAGSQFQTERRRQFRWSFLDNGETFSHHVEGILDRGFSEPGATEPIVVASYLIDDKSTNNGELDAYHRFLVGLGGERRLLAAPFRAADWEQTARPGGRWGRLLVEGQLVLRGEALDALQRLDEGAYWTALATALERPTSELRVIRAGLASKSHLERRKTRFRTPLRRRAAVRRSARIFECLERARLSGDPEERVTELARALHEASFRGGGSFDPLILETLLRQLGFRKHERAGTASARVRIRKAFEDEVIFPDNRDIVGRRGDRHLQKQLDVVVEPFGPVELHTMLDWAFGDAKTYFVAPEALRRPVR